MKKRLESIAIKSAVFFAIFLMSMLVTSEIINQGNTDLTAEITPASLPLIYININGEYMNCIHGYVSEMEGNYLRGAITPLQGERTIPIKVDTFGAVVTGVSYEIRTMDMSRLLENVTITDFTYEENTLYTVIPVKDLIADEQEYMLVVNLELSDGRVAKYYCRFIDKPELYLQDKLDFVKEFSDKTFDKEKAKDLIQYMESNSEGDNTSFANVNIHSNFEQLTWGSLKPMRISEKDIHIIDIDHNDATIRLDYTISAKGEMYRIRENFYIERGKNRIYLMDYNRTMNQIFDDENVVVANGKIFHGILSKPIHSKENAEGNVYCFVQGNRLYSYNLDTNSLNRIFSFWDKENDDARTVYDANNIKILYVDESGNVFFAVYGYMTRGIHEGEVGILIYRYDMLYNMIEEEMFIPYSKSYEILKHDIEQLCFVNSKQILYIMFNGTIYSINLETKKADLLASGLNETRFVSSEHNNMIAWQPADSLIEYTKLTFMSLDEMKLVDITAEANHILMPIGFFNKDFVYGSVALSDITYDSTGRTILPMDYIYIQNFNGEILKKYHNDGIYVIDVEFKDKMIKLERAIIDSTDGSFFKTGDDQIINSQDKEHGKNEYKSVATDEMETTWQTILKTNTNNENPKLLTPREVIYEGSRNYTLNVKDIRNRYYVYKNAEVDSIYTNVSDAVYRANEINGVVVNKSCTYAWKFDGRQANALVEIPEYDKAELEIPGNTTVSVCLNMLFKTAGIYSDARELLNNNAPVATVITEKLENVEGIELDGCTLDAALYYVSEGAPVIGMVNDGQAVLVVGYDGTNVSLFDPMVGEVKKMNIKDARNMFSNYGNQFVTYYKK